jgi:ribosome-associated heat shock protein Hsp15
MRVSNPMTRADPRCAPDNTPGDQHRVRLDKWLWAARFYKTRTLASQAIDTGQVRLNAGRVKQAHAVRLGDRVAVRKQGIVWEIDVTGLSDRRGSATEAAKLYRETAESAVIREHEMQQRKASAATAPQFPGRPTKRQRRKLEDFLNEP